MLTALQQGSNHVIISKSGWPASGSVKLDGLQSHLRHHMAELNKCNLRASCRPPPIAISKSNLALADLLTYLSGKMRWLLICKDGFGRLTHEFHATCRSAPNGATLVPRKTRSPFQSGSYRMLSNPS